MLIQIYYIMAEVNVLLQKQRRLANNNYCNVHRGLIFFLSFVIGKKVAGKAKKSPKKHISAETLNALPITKHDG